MFRVTKIRLNAKTGDARRNRALFVSDLHAISYDERDEKEVLVYEKRRCEEFERNGISNTKKKLMDFVDYANEMSPELVIFGGDIIDCPSIGNLTLLKQQFARLKMPFLYAPGNHDWNFEWEYRTSESRTKNFSLLCEICERDLEAFYCEKMGIQFLVLDSSEDCIKEKALQMLENCDENRRLCIVMHVPFSTKRLRKISIEKWNFETTMGDGAIPLDDMTETFYKRLSKFSDCLILGGHVHGYDNQVLGNGIRQIVAPAGCKGSAIALEW